MKRNVVFKSFLAMFLIVIVSGFVNVASAATLKFKDTIYRFHDKSWSAYNNILTTIMWMDNDVCYCLDYSRAVSPNSSSYKTKNVSVPAKLKYVVMNGYPNKDLGLGNDDMNYAATQLAVWYFSFSKNGNYFSLDNLVANKGYENYASKTKAKARELIAAANKNGNSYSIPTPSLSLDTSNVTQKTEGNYVKVGPYKATIKNGSTDKISASLSDAPSGSKIVDKNGSEKKSFSNSESIYVVVPASSSGSAKLNVSAKSKSYVTKVYSTNEAAYTTGPSGNKVYYQDQIVVVPQNKDLTKSASLKWKNTNGSIKLVKKGSDGAFLSGVKFALYDSKNNLVSTKTTNDEGVIVFSNLKPGSYYLVEKSTVPGYVLDSNKVNVTVRTSQTTETTITNKKVTAALKIIKVDNLEEKPIKGAVFEILNSRGKVIDTIKTDGNGVATSTNLEMGKYYYREKSVPNGYVLDTKKYEFTIDSEKIVEKKVVNEVKEGSIKIIKLDGEKKTPLKGAKFEVYDADGNVVGKLTTNSKGEAKIKKLKVGAYTVKEIEAPKGYKLEEKVYDLNVTTTNIDIVKTLYNFKEEQKYGSLKIVKIDGQTSTPIPGVKFELYDSNNNLVDTLTTDSEGIIFVEKLPLGNYYYKEIEAPGDYVIDDTMKIFSLSEENPDFEITVKNDKSVEVLGSLEILKIGDTSDEPLQGVKFELYDADGNKVGLLVTGADGKAKCSNLKLGKYTLKEIETAEGYRMTTEYVEFEVTEENLDVALTVVNMKDRLVQTGDFFSTNMLIVINVTVICTAVFIILKRRSVA